MRRTFIIIFALAYFSIVPFLFSKQPSNLDEFKNDFKKASVITDDVKRLQEYDKLSIKYGFAKKEKASDSKWIESISINPLDDSLTVVLINEESSESLIVRHSLGKLELYITCRKYLGIDSTEVMFRIGKSEAQTDYWIISSDNRAVFYSGSVDAILKQMIEADTFVSQITPYGDVPITTVFDIRGLKKLLIKYKDNFASVLEEEKNESEVSNSIN